MKRIGTCFLGVAALVFASHGAIRAEMPGDVPDKVRFSFGGMVSEAFTDAGYGSVDLGLGTSVNFEDTFGLPDNKDVFRGEVNWHVVKRQFVDFGYFNLDRSGSNVIDEDVRWGNYIFTAGANVSARFNSQFAYVAWRYLFIDVPKARISGSAGISPIKIEAGLKSTGSVTDLEGNVIAGTVDEAADVSAPVPMFGLQVDWEAARRLSFLMYFRQLYINNVQGIDGGLYETALRMNWWYSRHAGVCGGFEKTAIDLKSYESGDTKARFRYELRSYSLYLTFAF